MTETCCKTHNLVPHFIRSEFSEKRVWLQSFSYTSYTNAFIFLLILQHRRIQFQVVPSNIKHICICICICLCFFKSSRCT
ncbi:hypothetical protein Hanom_Chr12g01082121 [Helianthus anomalus]